MPTVPIIILNWNGAQDTVECVQAVLRQSFSDYIVHVVDNGSDEADYAFLRNALDGYPDVRLVRNACNLGFTRGCNRIMANILAQGGTDYIVLLNNDAVPDENWLYHLIASARTHRAGMVSSKMIDYYDRSRLDNAGHKMLNTAEILPVGHGEPAARYDRPFENMGACAGAAAYAVDMLRHIGLFDEYFDTGYEDAELGLRANVLGYRTIFEPAAVVYHKMSRSVNRIKDLTYLTKTQANIFYTYIKLMPLSVALLNLPFIVCKYLGVLVFDVVFWRARFLGMLARALYTVLIREKQAVWQSRRQFFASFRPAPSIALLRKQEFFLRHDVKRFFRYLFNPSGGMPVSVTKNRPT